MITLRSDLRILIASKPVDFRKGINGLTALVSTTLGANPYSGDVYIFRSKRNDRLKMVAWDGSGMVLVTKVLEDRHFTWPAVRDGAVHLSASEMALLLDGLYPSEQGRGILGAARGNVGAWRSMRTKSTMPFWRCCG